MEGLGLEVHYGSESDSDSDDEDYAPVSGEDSEGISASEKEDPEEGNDDSEAGMCKKKIKKKTRANKQSSMFGDERNDDDAAEQPQRTEEEEKKHADSLWTDFLKDVDPPVKKSVKPYSASTVVTQSQASNEKNPAESRTVLPTNPKKVTITQVFDFAGESVTVTKEVDANSKEAKEYSNNMVTKENNGKESKNCSPTEELGHTNTAGPGSKRPAGIGNVLEKIMNKKQKINTLDKSLLDWNNFKKEEGIEDDLSQFNKGKGGYLDKLAFLQRTDLRQFDVERNLRMTNRSKR